MNEQVSVSVPGAGIHIIDLDVRPDEGDDEIALRLAKTFPVGTIVGVGGAKWKITSKSPPSVHEVGKPEDEGLRVLDQFKDLRDRAVAETLRKPAPVPAPLPVGNDPHRPLPGEQWRPKDPRRKSGFTIKAVTDTEVIADDGRTVSLDRMKRYEKIG